MAADLPVQRSLDAGDSAEAVAYVYQAALNGRVLGHATVVEYATHRQLTRKSVEIKRLLAHSARAACVVRSPGFFLAAVLIDEALHPAQRQCLLHGRSVTLSCVNMRLSESPVEVRGL